MSNKIDKKLSGLNWITPQYENNPGNEINLIKNIQSHLEKDPRNKMILTNYNFLSTITNQKLFSPSRGYAGDGTSHPLKGNKYEKKYKDLMDRLIIKNKISVIYVVGDLENKTNFHYIKLYAECLNETFIFKELKSYELENCS